MWGLLCQLVEHLGEVCHLGVDVLVPQGGLPNFDTDGGSDYDDFVSRFNGEEFTESLGDDQPSAACELYRLVSCGQETAQRLYLLGSTFEFAGLHFQLNQFDAFPKFLFPKLGAPKAQTAGAFFGEDAVLAVFANQLVGHFQRNRETKALVNRSLLFANDELLGCCHGKTRGKTQSFSLASLESVHCCRFFEVIWSLWAENPQSGLKFHSFWVSFPRFGF